MTITMQGFDMIGIELGRGEVTPLFAVRPCFKRRAMVELSIG